MAARLVWTPELDDMIRECRSHRQTWDSIASAIGCSRWAVIERSIRLKFHDAPIVNRKPIADDDDNPNREPMRPGHPVSWGILTAGTVLEGTPYPVMLSRLRINQREDDTPPAQATPKQVA